MQFICDLSFPLDRYHYNVADTRLEPHVEKGNEDGLLISSISSCVDLWAVIMDAGTGFTDQVYQMSPHFLHKVERNFPSVPHVVVYALYLALIFTVKSRTGLWSSGRRISTSVLSLALITEALL